MSEIAVFGAGFVGVSTAIALARGGRDVVLVDKAGVGAGASFGNAGVIQSEAVEPYEMPRDARVLLRVMMGRDNGVAVRLAGAARQAGPLAAYFWHSSRRGVARASAHYAPLIHGATQAHLDLADLAGARGQFHQSGFRLRFSDRAVFDAVVRDAQRMARAHDLPMKVLSAEELGAAEPGLADCGIGGIEWSAPYTVQKPSLLLQQYFDYFQSIGGKLLCGDALSLAPQGQGWRFESDQGAMTVGEVVIATGANSAEVARRLGGRAPIIAKRGYHAVLTGGRGLNAPLVDEAMGLVYAPQGNQIRVTTGAEIGGRAAQDMPRQLRVGIAQAARLFDAGREPLSVWSGVRPCMPDMLPVMGASGRHRGLWYNFGHGHQGLTLGPLAGQMLAGAIMGEGEALDHALSPERFKL
ncbi:FAD-binding oxidoreductase [Rhodobacteraceae bacterium D3-12]|nr:FAD-binding oxidoreductase [Rhodobacteraceae bacterium D3-12]